MTKKQKRFILLNIPYLLVGILATNLGEAWRLSQTVDAVNEVAALAKTIPIAFSNPMPSLVPFDLIIGIICGAVLKIVVFIKGKNAKKYRHGAEYGTARWGNAQDIEPFMAPNFKDNIILTQTERLMMNSRPKSPKYARNKNVLVTGKTAKSILVSCGARLAPFDLDQVREITMYDELELDTLGDRKTALFLVMSDTDPTFNFLISMVYSQLFNLLCDKAYNVYKGRLPVHVRCLIDETANIGQIPNLEKLVATIRSREISACLFLQAKSQLKAIYKDNADTIIGNMDSQIFLGGTEPTTLKDLSQALGKETIDMYSTGESRGNNPSYSMNYQKSGKDLMTIDELAVMDGDKCILQLRGVRPFLSDKYDVTQHPLYKETGEYDDRNKLDIEKFVHQNFKVKIGEMFDVVKI